MPLSPGPWQRVPGRSALSTRCPAPPGTPEPPPAPSPQLPATAAGQGEQPAPKGRLLGRKAAFAPKSGLFSGRGTVTVRQQNCLTAQERQQKGQSEEGGEEEGRSPGSPIHHRQQSPPGPRPETAAPLRAGGQTNRHPAGSKGPGQEHGAGWAPAPRRAQPDPRRGLPVPLAVPGPGSGWREVFP